MNLLPKLLGILIGGTVGIIAILIYVKMQQKSWMKPESDVVRWINATHGPILAVNNKNIQFYAGVTDIAKHQKKEQKALIEFWDIKDKASLDKMIDWLMKEGHRVDYTGDKKEVAAWDYSRALSLLSSGYIAGYLQKEEALMRSLEIGKICQSEYSSWDAFMQAYFKGNQLWSSIGLGMKQNAYASLKKLPNSPYNIPWNLQLRKDWDQ